MGAKKTKTKAVSEPFSEDVYENIDLDSLVTYAVWSVEQSGETCTFERLVAECFTLFPKKFSLFRYPHWPDSARVNKSWLRCRTDKGLIRGKAKTGFVLTEKGRGHLQNLKSSLSLAVTSRRVAVASRRLDMARGHEDAVVRWIETSPHYRRYLADSDHFGITDVEFRNLLRCVMETPDRIIKEKIHSYKNALEATGRDDLLEFFGKCEQTYREPLYTKRQ